MQIGNFREPYEIGLGFYRALQAKALLLEVNALRDELAALAMDNPGQLGRQMRLVQAQRDEAERLRDFLARSTVRDAARAG
jgi:hypothetical protein